MNISMRLNLNLSDEDRAAIAYFLATANRQHELVPANTHGELDVSTLVQMLLEDVALMVRRPGCWEGSTMAQLLSSHGYVQ